MKDKIKNNVAIIAIVLLSIGIIVIIYLNNLEVKEKNNQINELNAKIDNLSEEKSKSDKEVIVTTQEVQSVKEDNKSNMAKQEFGQNMNKVNKKHKEVKQGYADASDQEKAKIIENILNEPDEPSYENL